LPFTKFLKATSRLAHFVGHKTSTGLRQGGNMQFTEETLGKVKVYHLKGKIMGGPETQVMCSRLKELIDAGTQWLVMDFREVPWINSTGVGAIVSCLTTLRKRGGDVRNLTLSCYSPAISASLASNAAIVVSQSKSTSGAARKAS
jgi:anti-sigma B factor antagonist